VQWHMGGVEMNLLTHINSLHLGNNDKEVSPCILYHENSHIVQPLALQSTL